jgi:hypothetical protein
MDGSAMASSVSSTEKGGRSISAVDPCTFRLRVDVTAGARRIDDLLGATSALSFRSKATGVTPSTILKHGIFASA